MIRLFDLIFALLGLVLFSPLIIIIYLIGYLETGSPFFFQVRMGKHKRHFYLIKFRTMSVGTKSVATHLMDKSSVTKIGKYLRILKLDELPQLWNVLVGEMSLVGPRPNLIDQYELIAERERKNVYSVRPGITGLAQVSKIDMSTPERLASADHEMISNFNLYFYFKYIIYTLLGKGLGDGISKNK